MAYGAAPKSAQDGSARAEEFKPCIAGRAAA